MIKEKSRSPTKQLNYYFPCIEKMKDKYRFKCFFLERTEEKTEVNKSYLRL